MTNTSADSRKGQGGDPGAEPPASSWLGQGEAAKHRRADALFRWLATGSGIAVVSAVSLIGVFLLVQAWPSLQANNANFLFSSEFDTRDAENLRFGIRDLLVVTVMSSAFALVIAMPLALGIALFLTQYAPPAVRRPFGYIIDTLAAVPSIVYGLWGIFVLGPFLVPVALWMNRNLGWIPIFATGNVSIKGGGTIFTAGIVLAVMILPIITSVTREVFRQTPVKHIEGALALGATRWEMIRTTVLPFGRSGYIAGSMLGLGRALGETVAVLVVLRIASSPATFSIFDGGYTFASLIASAAHEFVHPLPTGAYIAAGLVLFILTFVVNAIARTIANGKMQRL
ncbi:phosphate ABC transporter permease subunit PstC [Haloechinothrix sp. YIM 98757]|uniref:Phosphate transport system permease protein n=2 Tax=Haloechinothrix aidingensis TaxID=2752311 RepID=A0A838A842_9PSEU|nr:phosphate ABC transporter permease subunit PstC [Haloechinothrix aidingensis]MBA0124412.1 phosphate ABC transporter permease subunit PstC [Haloechinothrix aidingensis]